MVIINSIPICGGKREGIDSHQLLKAITVIAWFLFGWFFFVHTITRKNIYNIAGGRRILTVEKDNTCSFECVRVVVVQVIAGRRDGRREI